MQTLDGPEMSTTRATQLAKWAEQWFTDPALRDRFPTLEAFVHHQARSIGAVARPVFLA